MDEALLAPSNATVSEATPFGNEPSGFVSAPFDSRIPFPTSSEFIGSVIGLLLEFEFFFDEHNRRMLRLSPAARLWAASELMALDG
jgi:hypothetical protein